MYIEREDTTEGGTLTVLPTLRALCNYNANDLGPLEPVTSAFPEFRGRRACWEPVRLEVQTALFRSMGSLLLILLILCVAWLLVTLLSRM